jgi:hypothetical protein
MTQQRDIERLLDRWFSDGPDQAPDRVMDIVTDRIERQSQQPAWRLQRRPISVNAYAKLAVAAAAVLIVAVVGYTLLPGRSTGVGGPAPTASPTAAPTTPSSSTSTSAIFPAWFTPESSSGGAGILSSGSQTSRSFKPAFTYNVPEGWVNSLDVPIAYVLFPDTPVNKAEYALSGDTAQSIFMVSVKSPYFFCESWEVTRGTAAERVAFLAASDAFAVSEPVDITIGGLTGKQVDVRVDPDWKETCPGDPPGLDHRDARARAYLLDGPSGAFVIFVGSSHAADHEAFLAKATPVVESFKFVP